MKLVLNVRHHSAAHQRAAGKRLADLRLERLRRFVIAGFGFIPISERFYRIRSFFLYKAGRNRRFPHCRSFVAAETVACADYLSCCRVDLAVCRASAEQYAIRGFIEPHAPQRTRHPAVFRCHQYGGIPVTVQRQRLSG